jgi:hypothetical protein
MVKDYGRLYAGAYARAEYVKSVRAMIDALQQRHGVRGRASKLPVRARTGEKADAPQEQSAFQWPDDE